MKLDYTKNLQGLPHILEVEIMMEEEVMTVVMEAVTVEIELSTPETYPCY